MHLFFIQAEPDQAKQQTKPSQAKTKNKTKPNKTGSKPYQTSYNLT